MKSLKIKFIALTGLILFLASCKKDVTEDENMSFAGVSSSTEMQVPSSFSYKTDRKVEYWFSLNGSLYNGKYLIEIFDANPSANGGLIKSIFVDANGTTQGNLQVPAFTELLYVRLTSPAGDSEVVEKEVGGTSMSHDFGASQKGKGATVVVSPSCSSGCDVDLAASYNTNSNITINTNDAGTIFCLSDTDAKNITLNKAGVTLRICGELDVETVTLNNDSHIEITDGSDVEIKKLVVNGSSGTYTFYNADIKIKEDFKPGGHGVNYGTLLLDKKFEINGTGTFENNGTLTVKKNFKLNGTSFTNNGPAYFEEKFDLNGSSTTTNNCSMEIKKNITFNSTMNNYGYLYGEEKLTINGAGITNLYNGAHIQIKKKITINAAVTGYGSTSLFQAIGDEETLINGGGKLQGTLEYCDPDGIETNYGSIISPAVVACNVYIPTSSCNPNGHGTPTVTDTDNDGVADENDEYPNDPDRAANSYYPSSTEFGTLAYEDLWPFQGDFDFNDLVIDYQYTLVLNANNDVVDVLAQYVPKAKGASYDNSFGIQFDVASSAVSSVTGQNLNGNFISNNGNGTESGQSKAVVIAFESTGDVLPNNTGKAFVNTVDANPYVQPDTLDIAVYFGSAQSVASLGDAPFNPFIIIDQDRDKEVHLADNEPTDKANTGLFGSGDDNSSTGSGNYYTDENNLPWAINVTTGFQYPEEKVDIVNVYTLFSTWAQSGGAQATDWNQDLPGYITSDVYDAGL